MLDLCVWLLVLVYIFMVAVWGDKGSELKQLWKCCSWYVLNVGYVSSSNAYSLLLQQTQVPATHVYLFAGRQQDLHGMFGPANIRQDQNCS
jgi:hypothetical protein